MLDTATTQSTIDAILNHSTAGGTAKVLMLALAMSEQPQTAAELAEMANVDTRNVRRALKGLESAGEIRCIPGTPGRGAIKREIMVRCLPGCTSGSHAGSESSSSDQRYAKATIGPRLRTAVLERDAYRCKGCGTHLNLTCDHIIPECQGGPTVLENLQALCMPCNSAKGTMSQADWEHLLRTGEIRTVG